MSKKDNQKWKTVNLPNTRNDKRLFDAATRHLFDIVSEITGISDLKEKFDQDKRPLTGTVPGQRTPSGQLVKPLRLVQAPARPPAKAPAPPKPDPPQPPKPSVEKPKPSPRVAEVTSNFMRAEAVPLAIGSRFETCEPSYQKFREGGKDCLTLRHRAYIGDVNIDPSNPEFEITAYDLTPMNPAVFPVAPDTAKNYQFWKPGRVHFHFATSVGADKGGVVMMAHQLNPNAPVPTTKRELMNFSGAVRNVAWREDHDLILDEKATKQIGWRNVGRGFSLASNGVSQIPIEQQGEVGDPRFDQMGHLLFATAGYDSSAPTIVGELYVDYTLHFKEIAVNSLQENCSIITLNDDVTHPFGPAGNPGYQWLSLPGDLNIRVDVDTASPSVGKLYVSAPGDYFVTVIFNGAGLGTAGTSSITNGGTLVDAANPNSIAVVAPNTNTSSAYMQADFIARVEDISYGFAFNLTGTQSSVVSVQFRVNRITPGSLDWRNGVRGYGAPDTTYTIPYS